MLIRNNYVIEKSMIQTIVISTWDYDGQCILIFSRITSISFNICLMRNTLFRKKKFFYLNRSKNITSLGRKIWNTNSLDEWTLFFRLFLIFQSSGLWYCRLKIIMKIQHWGGNKKLGWHHVPPLGHYNVNVQYFCRVWFSFP